MGSSINDLSNKITHKSDLPQVNFKFGNNIEKSPSFWNIFGKGLVAGTTIGMTKALTGGIFTATQNSATGTQTTKQTAEQAQQAQIQQWENQSINLARTSDSATLEKNIQIAEAEINKLDTEIGTWADLARGAESQAITDQEAKVKEYETKYGFGSGDKTTATAKEGSAYAEAQKSVDTIETQIKNITEDNSTISSRLTEIDTQNNTNKTELENLPNQISEIKSKINNLGARPEINDSMSAGDKAKARQAQKTYDTQKEALESEKQKLTNRETELKKNQQALEAEKTQKTNQQNANKEKLNKLNEKLTTAKATAESKSKATDGTDLETKYKDYKNAKNELENLRGKATRAARKLESLNNQRTTLELSRDMNKRALEYKNKFNSDNKQAMENYGDVSGKNDGNWFSRNLGWLWGKGKTAQAFRANRKERNEYINTYMQNYGVSKKDAKKALSALSSTQANATLATTPQSNTSSDQMIYPSYKPNDTNNNLNWNNISSFNDKDWQLPTDDNSLT